MRMGEPMQQTTERQSIISGIRSASSARGACMEGVKIGRPTVYTKELGTEICERLADGASLREILRDENMPCQSAVFRWLLDERYKDFKEQYETARNIQAETLFDELLEIADDGENDWVLRQGKEGDEWWSNNGENIQRSRLRVDTRKWFLSKVLPKKYGEKIDLTSGGDKIPPQNGITFVNFGKDQDNAAGESKV